MKEKPNQYQETTEEDLNKKPGFELPKAQAENLARELSSVANLVSHDQPVKEKDIENLDSAIQGMKVEEIEKIPDLKKNAKIYQEINDGNFENTYKLTYITDEIAEIIGTQKNINLSHLKQLTDRQAELICKDISSINLAGLTTLTDNVAEYLGKTRSRVELFHLATISDKAAESRSKVGGSLYLGITTLSDNAAEYLSKHMGGELILDELESLSDSAAKSFGENHKGELRLRNFRIEFSDEAASFLAKHDGRIRVHDSLAGQVIENKIKKFKK